MRKKTHGEAGKGRISVEYRIWGAMKTRCNNPKSINYYLYGGRGIKVCPEWENSYERFLLDMGRRPGKDYSIERIDNMRGYSKNNCKWILKKNQARNRRNCVVFGNETMADAAKRLGLSKEAIRDRIKHGYSLREAFTIYRLPMRNQYTLLPSNRFFF